MKLDVVGTVLCHQCPAACCRYVSLPVDKPRTLRDYDDIRWYLMHEGFSVFVEDGDWYVQIQARCRNLRQDNLCGVYETRPRICAEYEPGECDYLAGGYGYDHYFTHASQLEEFVEHKLGKRLGPPKSPEASNGRRSGRASAGSAPHTRRRPGASAAMNRSRRLGARAEI